MSDQLALPGMDPRVVDRAAETHDEMRALSSDMLQRYMFLRQAGITFRGARDMYEVLGYARILSARDYRDRYARGGIAARVVEALPKATWRGDMTLVEDKNPENDTPFEKAWKDLAVRLRINSVFERADVLSQLSQYSIILIGAPGDFNTELPRGNPNDLKYLQPFGGGGGPGLPGMTNGGFNSPSMAGYVDATIQYLETNAYSERFGLPTYYLLRRTDLTSAELQRPIHWSRIIHIADGCLDNDVYGTPSLERVWNLFDDLDKVTGGGAEAFWLRANQGTLLNVDKDANLTDPEKADLKNQAEEFQHQLRRFMVLRKTKLSSLGSDVANFSSPSDAIITQIAGAKAIPKRVLTGSEMGELASSQDRENWRDQVNGRQTSYAGPYVVRNLADRLIRYGYLPTPTKGALAYEVQWPHTQVMTEQEKAEGAANWTKANQQQGAIVFTVDEIRDHWYGLEPIPPEAVQAPERVTDTLDGTVPVDPNEDDKGTTATASGTKPRAMREGKYENELARVLDAAIRANNVRVVHRILGIGDASYSSTQINVPATIADKVMDIGLAIPDSDLAADERELNPHITVKYGFDIDDPTSVIETVSDFGALSVLLGVTKTFQTPDYDVVYIEVTSPDLVKLNGRLSDAIDAPGSTFPNYTPHMTVAYVQPGLGEKYTGNTALAGTRFQASALTFSNRQHEQTQVPLA